ncbi:hypothetical protein NQ314_015303, partial [Rhamnusium bicolor]
MIEIKDFENICRACLCVTNVIDVKPLLTSNIVSVFKNLTDIEIEEENRLPKNVCMNCIEKLEDISTFIDICKKNDIYLKSILERKDSFLESDHEQFDGFEDDDVNEHDATPLEKKDVNVIIKREVDIKLEKSRTERNRRSKRNITKQHKDKRKKCEPEKVKKKRSEECSCNICGKTFTRRGGLKRHSKIHLGIKPFECNKCGKTFVEKGTLNRHSLTHTGEKPFECNLCGKVSTRKDQILEHINKHHPNAVNCDFVITEHKRNEVDDFKSENKSLRDKENQGQKS